MHYQKFISILLATICSINLFSFTASASSLNSPRKYSLGFDQEELSLEYQFAYRFLNASKTNPSLYIYSLLLLAFLFSQKASAQNLEFNTSTTNHLDPKFKVELMEISHEFKRAFDPYNLDFHHLSLTHDVIPGENSFKKSESMVFGTLLPSFYHQNDTYTIDTLMISSTIEPQSFENYTQTYKNIFTHELGHLLTPFATNITFLMRTHPNPREKLYLINLYTELIHGLSEGIAEVLLHENTNYSLNKIYKERLFPIFGKIFLEYVGTENYIRKIPQMRQDLEVLNQLISPTTNISSFNLTYFSPQGYNTFDNDHRSFNLLKLANLIHFLYENNREDIVNNIFDPGNPYADDLLDKITFHYENNQIIGFYDTITKQYYATHSLAFVKLTNRNAELFFFYGSTTPKSSSPKISISINNQMSAIEKIEEKMRIAASLLTGRDLKFLTVDQQSKLKRTKVMFLRANQLIQEQVIKSNANQPTLERESPALKPASKLKNQNLNQQMLIVIYLRSILNSH